MRCLSLFIVAMMVLNATASNIPTRPYLPGTKVKLFSNIVATTYTKIEGASISIEYGYQMGLDKLEVTSTLSAVTVVWDEDTGVLSLHGRESTQAYVDIIRSATFLTKSADGAARQISWNFGNNTIYNSNTGHFYTMFKRPGFQWEDALKICSQSTFFGIQGYLATITSQDEYDEIAERFKESAWVGGTDKSQEGYWRWVTGPEGKENNNTGRLFWIGQSSFQGGKPADDGVLSLWARFQPDNNQGDQHFLSLKHLDSGIGLFDDGVQSILDGYVCEYGGLDSAELEATMSNFEGSVQVVPGCELFSDQASCQATGSTMGCEWGTSCVLTSCLRHKTEGACDAQWNCEFNADASPPVCEATSCSKYKNADACNADLTCLSSGSGNALQCLPSVCSDKDTAPAKCNSIPGSPCMYHTDNNRCMMTEFLDCISTDIVFLVDGDKGMNAQFGRHGDGMEAVMETLNGFAWFAPFQSAGTSTYSFRMSFGFYGGATGAVSRSNLALQSTYTGAKSDINWLENQYTSQGPVPNGGMLEGALNDAIKALGGARNPTIIVIGQGPLKDAAKAAAVVNANKAIRFLGVVVRHHEAKSAADKAAELSFDSVFTDSLVVNTELPQLIHNLEGLCDPKHSFGATATKSSYECSRYSDRASCEGKRQCAWDNSDSACVFARCTMLTVDKCSGTCAPAAPGSAACVRQNACTGTSNCAPGCALYNNVCLEKCTSNPNEDSCEADPARCAWNPATGCTAIKCTSNNERACINEDPVCAWNGDSCYISKCALKNISSCSSDTTCEWSTVEKKCMNNVCAKIVDERACDDNYLCAWDVSTSPAVCAPRKCGYYNKDAATAKPLCIADPDCFWELKSMNQQKDQCIPKSCRTQSSAAQCALMSSCVWRDKQCRENRFVQCPAIDVVFVIDGAQVMSQPFGRHTSGFSALIQNIRVWAKEAPLATTADSLGFRTAVVEFGPRQNVKLAVNGQRGGKGKLTGNINEIMDELRYFEETPLIGAGVASNKVYLQTALQYVQTIFTSSPQPSSDKIKRKTIVMLMGSSPIDDGNAVSVEIDKLRAMGVTVFSNYIRRFEAISKADIDTAAMYRPLGSDPIATHFSLATVDNVDDTVLQSFCDPTTTIGMALKISRSGDIPCGWLMTSQECTTQNYCSWDATKPRTCREANQCPQLGCRALPQTFLDLGYKCEQCSYANGAFDCTTPGKVQTGSCVVSSCVTLVDDKCAANSQCTYDTGRQTCARNMCPYGPDVTACQKDYGCSFNYKDNKCVANSCSQYREFSACTIPYVLLADVQMPACGWNTAPPCGSSDGCPALCRNQECYTVADTGPTPAADCVKVKELQCEHDPGMGCISKACSYDATPTCDLACTSQKCGNDPYCYWDPSNTTCKRRTQFCIYSDNVTSACSATCGPSRLAVTTTRLIAQPLEGSGDHCSLTTESIGKCGGETDSSLRDDCDKWCGRYTSLHDCTSDSMCSWNGKCITRKIGGCQRRTATECAQDNACFMMEGLCVDKVETCQYDDSEMCTRLSCSWVEPQVATKSILYNTNDEPTLIFTNVGDSTGSADTVDGAVVYIEDNYQVGKDILISRNAPKKITSSWNIGTGVLTFTGVASVAEYGQVIKDIRFFTSSTSRQSRTVSWSLGKDTFYSSKADRHYRYYYQSSISWAGAKSKCAETKLLAYSGYLATPLTANEANLLTSKLEAEGWLGGSDAQTEGLWKWVGGPSDNIQFWSGASPARGGSAIGDLYSNWEGPTPTNAAGEPSNTQSGSSQSGEDYLYLLQNGYWSDKDSITFKDSKGYVCEYKGAQADATPSYLIGGSASIALVGCFPEACTWHTASSCQDDMECMLTDRGCVLSCGSMGSRGACESRQGECRWDTEVTPAACSKDDCSPRGMDSCLLTTMCRWDDTGKCMYRTGCEKYDEVGCKSMSMSCVWQLPEVGSKQGASCTTRPCSSYSADECRDQPLCAVRTTSSNSTCIQKTCDHVQSKDCDKDPSCNWLSASAAFAQIQPGGATVTPFANVNSGPSAITNDAVDGATITISEGYEKDFDELYCDATDCSPAAMTVTWSAPALFIKIIGTPVNGLRMYQYVQSIKFRTSSNSPRRRTISFVLGNGMTMVPSPNTPLMSYYYKVLPIRATDIASARSMCSKTSYFGLPGALATIKSEKESIALRLIGARGVFDAQDDSKGCVWSWSGTTKFWSGCGSMGLPEGTAYAQWESGQPMGLTTTATGYVLKSGKWMAMNIANGADGVICQYGNGNSASTVVAGGLRSVQPNGCFPKVCKQYTVEGDCRKNYMCDWREGECVTSERCSFMADSDTCNKVLNCFWDYENTACISGPRTMCNDLDIDACKDKFFADSCEYDTNVKSCVPKGCSKYPFASVCNNNALCRWAKESICVPRRCGYQKEDQCWADKTCIFDHRDASSKTCKPNPCYNLGTDACKANAQCLLNGTTCLFNRCFNDATVTDPKEDKCMLDPVCLKTGTQCTRTECDTNPAFMYQTACNNEEKCFFDSMSKTCQTDQCIVLTTKASCSEDTSCVWKDTNCTHTDAVGFGAPPTNSCERTVEDEPDLWWVWFLLALIVIGLAGIIWRLYLAYKHGYSFTDPARYNKKFQAQELYSKELADMANDDVRTDNDADLMNQALLQEKAASPAVAHQRPPVEDL